VIHSAGVEWSGPEPDPAPTITFADAYELRLSPTSFLVIERTQLGTETV
jgi:hypothetical protein